MGVIHGICKRVTGIKKTGWKDGSLFTYTVVALVRSSRSDHHGRAAEGDGAAVNRRISDARRH
jgi:hypothetical protein